MELLYCKGLRCSESLRCGEALGIYCDGIRGLVWIWTPVDRCALTRSHRCAVSGNLNTVLGLFRGRAVGYSSCELKSVFSLLRDRVTHTLRSFAAAVDSQGLVDIFAKGIGGFVG